jgi:3-oxoacyl-[acyl-carrier protein] reductase
MSQTNTTCCGTKKLSGKVAVVTGASKGIGAGIAKKLACGGASVVVNYASDKSGAERVVADIVAAGGKAVAVKASVSNAVEVKALFAETAKAFGKIDILVNNAGIFEFSPLEGVTEEHYRKQFDTNVLGPILVTQEALNHFNPAGGSIINISSVVSEALIPNSSVYSGTKGALDAITRSLAAELGGRQIRVNAVNPGMVDTEGAQTAGFIGSDFQKGIEATTPLGRIGKPADIAGIVAFLASDDASWITGETHRVSGGTR